MDQQPYPESSSIILADLLRFLGTVDPQLECHAQAVNNFLNEIVRAGYLRHFGQNPEQELPGSSAALERLVTYYGFCSILKSGGPTFDSQYQSFRTKKARDIRSVVLFLHFNPFTARRVFFFASH